MTVVKRLPNLTLSILAGFLLLLANPNSVEAALLKLNPSSGEVSEGSTVEVIVDTEGEAVDSAVAVVTFNTNRVEISNIAGGDFFDSVSIDTSQSGEVAITGTLSIGNIEGKTGSGVLATLSLSPKVSSGSVALGFRCSAADIDDSNIMSTGGSNLLTTDEQCSKNVEGSYTVGGSTGGETAPTATPIQEESTTKGEQPVLPEELPESGFQDLFKWFVSGLALLGVGLLLL